MDGAGELAVEAAELPSVRVVQSITTETWVGGRPCVVEVRERDFADADERGGVALRRGARVVVARRVDVRVQGGDDGLGADVAELAGDDGPPVVGLRDVQPVAVAGPGAVGVGEVAEVRRGAPQ